MQYSRIISYLFFLLSVSFFVCASPVGAPSNELAKRGGGGGYSPGSNDDAVLDIVTKLKAKVDVIIPQIDALSGHGGNPSALLAQVSAAVDVSVTALLALEPEKSGTYTDKKHQIAVIFVGIIVDLVVVLGKFPITLIFLTITAVVDIFINKLLLALEVAIVGILEIAVVLVTHVDLFVSLKLVLTIATFGLVSL